MLKPRCFGCWGTFTTTPPSVFTPTAHGLPWEDSQTGGNDQEEKAQVGVGETVMVLPPSTRAKVVVAEGSLEEEGQCPEEFDQTH